MRLGPLVPLALIALVTPSHTYAQTSAPTSTEPRTAVIGHAGNAVTMGFAMAGPARGTARPDDVVARVMSFDRNNDGKVEKAELAERMYAVMDRGDADGDGALDPAELRTLATARPVDVAVRGFGHGRYMMGSETEVSSRRHLEGAIDDLRIEAARKEPALAIVRAFSDTREADAETELLDVMRTILSDDQMRIFTTALERQRDGGPQRLMISPDLQARGVEQTVRFVLLANVERRVATFNLAPEAKDRATAALKQYRSRLRPSEADRAELGRQLASVLTSEESDDFLAAIARQPVVAAGGVTVFSKDMRADPTVRAVPAIRFVTQ